MRLLICGDRNGGFEEEIEHLLTKKAGEIKLLITGACRGVDLCAEGLARTLEIPYVGVPARWGELGKRAGPLRNQEMLDRYKPTRVVGFHKSINWSRGTKDMLTRSKRGRVDAWLFDGEKWSRW